MCGASAALRVDGRVEWRCALCLSVCGSTSAQRRSRDLITKQISITTNKNRRQTKLAKVSNTNMTMNDDLVINPVAFTGSRKLRPKWLEKQIGVISNTRTGITRRDMNMSASL